MCTGKGVTLDPLRMALPLAVNLNWNRIPEPPTQQQVQAETQEILLRMTRKVPSKISLRVFRKIDEGPVLACLWPSEPSILVDWIAAYSPFH